MNKILCIHKQMSWSRWEEMETGQNGRYHFVLNLKSRKSGLHRYIRI